MHLTIPTLKTFFLATSLSLILGACAVKADSVQENNDIKEKDQLVSTVSDGERKADALFSAGRHFYNKALDTEDMEERDRLNEQAYYNLHDARAIYSTLVEKNVNNESFSIKLLECNKLHYGAIKKRKRFDSTVSDGEREADALFSAGRHFYNKALDIEDIKERDRLNEQAYYSLHDARAIYSTLVEKNVNNESFSIKLLECNKLHYGAIKKLRF